MSIGSFGQREPDPLARLRERIEPPTGANDFFTAGAIPLPPFPQKETWTVQDAARIRHLMVTFFGSPQGVSAMDTVSHVMASGAAERTNPYPSGILSTLMRSVWQSPDFSVIFAERDFAAMMVAAAMSAPKDASLHPDELLSENGIVVLQEAIAVGDLSLWKDDIRPIRAISWTTLGGGRVFVVLWADGSDTLTSDGRTIRTDIAPYLYFEVFGFVPFDSPADGAVAFELALLRSVMAISSSSHARRQDVKPAKPRKLRPEYRDVPVRRLYLSRPEFGDAELASAKGKPHRLHWVRGHWRNQWFPKLEDHRTIWIGGHPRGNAALGSVGGDRVYVALPPVSG